MKNRTRSEGTSIGMRRYWAKATKCPACRKVRKWGSICAKCKRKGATLVDFSELGIHAMIDGGYKKYPVIIHNSNLMEWDSGDEVFRYKRGANPDEFYKYPIAARC